MHKADFLVIGAGIAGASAAAELATHGSVILVEAEDQPGYHSTGRSAAMFTETYGPPAIRALTAASRDFLTAPPDGFCGSALLLPRGILLIGREDQTDSLDRAETVAQEAEGGQRLSGREAIELAPILRPDYVAGAISEPAAMEIDVHGLHGGFLRLAKARGAQVLTGASVLRLERRGAAWHAETAAGPVEAGTVVNAAGAWADGVGEMAGARTIGLVPKRRTAVVFEPARPVDASDQPMVIDVDETFYVKAESGNFLASPADATPVPPCDVQPDELDIATAIDRVERATTLSARRLVNRWAGLRSFVEDGLPVVGWDDRIDGFFWLAGQGGYGIQTAPAMARLAGALIAGRPVPADLGSRGITVATLSPDRLAKPGDAA